MFTFQYNTNSMVVVEAVAFATSPLKHLLLLTVVSSVIALQLPSNDPLLSISTANWSRPIAEDDHHDFFDDLDVHFVSSHTSKEGTAYVTEFRKICPPLSLLPSITGREFGCDDASDNGSNRTSLRLWFLRFAMVVISFAIWTHATEDCNGSVLFRDKRECWCLHWVCSKETKVDTLSCRHSISTN